MRYMILILLLWLVACAPDEGPLEVFFCPQESCSQLFALLKNPKCAFYKVDEPQLLSSLPSEKTLVDYHTHEDFGIPIYRRRGLMHHKFCVEGDVVITGSYNPAVSERKNFNNVIVLRSATLAKAYEKEWRRVRGRSLGTEGASWGNNTHMRQVVFCQVGNCRHMLSELIASSQNVSFMLFSFTDRSILEQLTNAKDKHIRGLLEKAGNRYALDTLRAAGIPVYFDTRKGKLHHKVWILDDTIVTGSYNPSNNGHLRNDENMLIVRDERIAQAFQEEFERLYGPIHLNNSQSAQSSPS